MLWRMNIEKPLAYYKCGQFEGKQGWKHKPMCLEQDFEIIIGLKEEVYIQVEDQQFTIQHGDILLIPPGVNYYGYHPSNEGVSFFWLHFFPIEAAEPYSLESFKNHLIGSELTNHREAINNGIFIPSYFKLTFCDKPFILMKQILDISNLPYYSTLAADYLVTGLLIELTDQYSKQLQNADNLSGNSQKFSQILEWIRVHIYDDITVNQIAEAFSFNADHLTRMFNRKLGMSTIKYINTLKLNLVKEFLCTTNKSIKEIAYKLNFKDEKYLMRLFKSYEKMTPSQFRDAYTKVYTNTVSVDPDIPIPQHLSDKVQIIQITSDL